MARDIRDAAGNVKLDAQETATVEHVLGMKTGYVLNFNDPDFNDFVQRQWGVDVTAPTYTDRGTSKANRLRGLLTAFTGVAAADVLRKFYEYRRQGVANGAFEALNSKMEEAYLRTIDRLDGVASIDSSTWTGREGIATRVAEIRILGPIAFSQLSALIIQLEECRFNDPETADALNALRDLRDAITALIEAAEHDQPMSALYGLINRHRDTLSDTIRHGAKMVAVAPAMTLGVVHLLALLTGTLVDTQLVGTVYAALLGHDALKNLNGAKRNA